MRATAYVATPFGPLEVTETNGAVASIHLLRGANVPAAAEQAPTPLLLQAVEQLREYLAGVRKTFTLPLAPCGTPFQQAVWGALRQIPYGETRSYKQVAEMVGNAQAARAVGLANNKNPVLIVTPCHRVLGADGSLTGYAEGLDVKDFLLRLEREHL